jgi:4-hydroxyphenylpyruvate dioxygenase
VRGVGGGLLYFVDSKSNLANFWDVDFNAVSAVSGAQSAYLTSVDHISQSLHYGEMLSWLLFYTSLFDVSKTPAQDIIDPGGVLQSQVVQTEDGRLRIVLNASQSERTQSAWRSAHRIRDERHFCRRGAVPGERRQAAADPGKLL